MSIYHFGLGMWMRNNWGLWAHGPLAAYLEQFGVHHPDDMSGLILDTFWRHLNGLPLEVTKHAAISAEWYREETVPEPARCPHCNRRIQLTLSIDRKKPDGRTGRNHFGRCCIEGSIWGWNVDMGWFKPDEKLLKVFQSGFSDLCKHGQ